MHIICKVMWGNSVNKITPCIWGNSVKTASDSYNFTGTLAIEMYLGKHDAYSILNTSH